MDAIQSCAIDPMNRSPSRSQREPFWAIIRPALSGGAYMNHVPVQSTSIATIAYDGTTSVLEIRFNNTTTYRYFLVPESTHQGFSRAPSKGVFFNQFIRGRYAFTKL
jgi:hypothetical protein